MRPQQAETGGNILRGNPFTVVIPAFNAELTLPTALRSVLRGTVLPDEVVVVDDGSHDQTAAVAKTFGVRYIHQKNAGPSVARNVGIDAVETPLVAFLDADDTVAEGGILRRVALLGEADLLITGADPVFGDSGRLLTFAEVAKAPAIIKSPSGWLARREAIISAGGFRSELRSLEDVEIVMRLVARGSTVWIAAAPTFHYSGVTPGRKSLIGQALLFLADEMISDHSPFAPAAPASERCRLGAKYLRNAANIFAAASDRDGLRAARVLRKQLGLGPSPELVLAATPRLYSALVHTLRRETRDEPPTVGASGALGIHPNSTQ